MAIIYGIGQHFDLIVNDYLVPVEDISCIIDNYLAKTGLKIDGMKIYTWEEFEVEQEKYPDKEFVIGGKAQFNNIKQQIVENIKNARVFYIDDWVKKYPPKNSYIGFLIEKGKQEMTIDLMERCGTIQQELLKKTVVFPDRTAALKAIPKGGICVEVGVAFGDFSKKIMETVNPELFVAVDMFSDKTTGFFDESDLFVKQGITHEEYYRNRFVKGIKAGKVKIEKGLSWDCISKMDDDSIDYLYLDAAHDYESVKRDIETLYPKMKNKGIIQFNDYTMQENYGICPAVNRFVNTTGSQVAFYCLSKRGYDDIGVCVKK